MPEKKRHVGARWFPDIFCVAQSQSTDASAGPAHKTRNDMILHLAQLPNRVNI